MLKGGELKLWLHGFLLGNLIGLGVLVMLLGLDGYDFALKALMVIGAGTLIVLFLVFVFVAACLLAISHRRHELAGKGLRERA
jgi:hypothetical protein